MHANKNFKELNYVLSTPPLSPSSSFLLLPPPHPSSSFLFRRLLLPTDKDKPGSFRKEDRDIPFSGLPKTNNEMSITRLLDPYNSTYNMSFPRITQEQRQQFASKDYKSDAIPNDKPNVKNLDIYGPDKDRGMKVRVDWRED